MIVYRNYVELMKKQFPIVLVYAAILITLVLVLSNTTQEKTFTGYEQTKVRIAVFDEDETVMTASLQRYLKEYCDFVTIDGDYESQMDAIVFREVYYILTIPSGFTEHFLSEDSVSLTARSVDASKESTYVNQIVNAYLDKIQLYHAIDSEADIGQLVSDVEKILPTKAEVIKAGDDSVKEENAETNYYFNLLGFALLGCIIIVVCTAMTAYRKQDIYKRHEVSPISPLSMNLQLLLGNMVYCGLYTVLFLALGIALGNEQELNLRILLYWCNTLAYAASILFFAYFLAFRLKHRLMINVIANMVALVLSVISGIFIRQEYLPGNLIKVSTITPVYWFVRGNDTIMKLSEYSFGELLPLFFIIGIQLLFSGAFFSLVLVGAKIDDVRK